MLMIRAKTGPSPELSRWERPALQRHSWGLNAALVSVDLLEDVDSFPVLPLVTDAEVEEVEVEGDEVIADSVEAPSVDKIALDTDVVDKDVVAVDCVGSDEDTVTEADGSETEVDMTLLVVETPIVLLIVLAELVLVTDALACEVESLSSEEFPSHVVYTAAYSTSSMFP